MKNNYKQKILFIDTETGGQIPGKHSLFSIALVIWDIENGIEDSIEFFKKDTKYLFTKEAVNINKFNEESHNLKAIESIDIINEIDKFCDKYFPNEYLIPIGGHNIQFDVNFLKVFYTENNRSFTKRFSHRMIDTYSIARYLHDASIIDLDLVSSSSLFNYFKIDINNRHSAIDDAKATALLYEKMIDLIKSRI
jgi:DNA polymerase III epsilon subunit-like protein